MGIESTGATTFFSKRNVKVSNAASVYNHDTRLAPMKWREPYIDSERKSVILYSKFDNPEDSLFEVQRRVDEAREAKHLRARGKNENVVAMEFLFPINPREIFRDITEEAWQFVPNGKTERGKEVLRQIFKYNLDQDAVMKISTLILKFLIMQFFAPDDPEFIKDVQRMDMEALRKSEEVKKKCKVDLVSLHLDERTPHIHALVSTYNEKEKKFQKNSVIPNKQALINIHRKFRGFMKEAGYYMRDTSNFGIVAGTMKTYQRMHTARLAGEVHRRLHATGLIEALKEAGHTIKFKKEGENYFRIREIDGKKCNIVLREKTTKLYKSYFDNDTGEHGDYIAFYKQITGRKFYEAVRDLNKHCDEELTYEEIMEISKGYKQEPPKTYKEAMQKYIESMIKGKGIEKLQAGVMYLQDRGLDLKTAYEAVEKSNAKMVTTDKSIIFCINDEAIYERLVNPVKRDGEEIKHLHRGSISENPFLINPGAKKAVVVEGVQDALAMYEMFKTVGKNDEYCIVATMGNAAMSKAARLCRDKDEVVLAFDNDEPGKQHQEQFLGKIKANVKIREIEEYKGFKGDPLDFLVHIKRMRAMEKIHGKAKSI